MTTENHAFSKASTAALLVIGNEILSGKVQDVHVAFLGKKLTEIGIVLSEVRMIPDQEKLIIDNVNLFRNQYDYVFTTGGIGPTHDDITAPSVAKAFGVSIAPHPEAVKAFEGRFSPEYLTEAMLRMTRVPAGAELLKNPVTVAPGFKIGNVFVMPGVPNIMHAMYDFVVPYLEGGEPVASRTVRTHVIVESQLSDQLSAIQSKNPDVEIGSYPAFHKGKFGVSMVVRSCEEKALDRVETQIIEMLKELGDDEPILGEL